MANNARSDPRRRLALGLWLSALGVYSLCGGGRFFSGDETGPFQLTSKIATLGAQSISPSNVTLPGVDGAHWNLQGPALSVFALPFYGVGAVLARVLPQDVQRGLAGEPLTNDAGVVWGGDIRIFAVSFFNAFASATLLVVLFWLYGLLGFERRPALWSTIAVGTSTLLFAHSKNFFTHTLVALLLLASFTALVHWRVHGHRRLLSWSGVFAGLMLLTRVDAAICLPWLAGFCLIVWPDNETPASSRGRLRHGLRFVAPVAVAASVQLLYNYLRFGHPLVVGYSQFAQFDGSFFVGLFGHLASVGRSIFVYSPMLLLAMPYWRRFGRRFGPETATVMGIAISSLALYSQWSTWHGAWCFGNRYLLPLVALLCLPLPMLFGRRGLGTWLCVGSIGFFGLVVQILGLAVNISFVHYAYHLGAHGTPMLYLWSPAHSQLALHWDALSRGFALDPWLYRTLDALGFGATCLFALPSVACLVLGISWIVRAQRPPASR